VPYLSASALVIHYEEALYQVYGPLPLLVISILKKKVRLIRTYAFSLSC